MDTVTQGRLFDYERWERRADELAQEYRRAAPFPSTVLENFLEPQAVRDLYREYDRVDWMSYRHYNENKQGGNIANLPPLVRSALEELNSPAFLRFLTRLTGIENLIADHELGSGGIHQSVRGGFLNIHADFTVHPYHADWHRRINILVYLNERWEADWGGELELWATDMSRCVRRVAPVFNRCVIFNTAQDSFHGHPEPMTCPDGVHRRSIALYYYTHEPDVKAVATEYRARPGDGSLKSGLIYFDKLAVAAFHKLKATLHLPDNVATSIMSVFRKKP
jgi:Rps23 Pro-64 3,4-dihydroxylase Tpa1-like proline 4-hydroxylase